MKNKHGNNVVPLINIIYCPCYFWCDFIFLCCIIKEKNIFVSCEYLLKAFYQGHENKEVSVLSVYGSHTYYTDILQQSFISLIRGRAGDSPSCFGRPVPVTGLRTRSGGEEGRGRQLLLSSEQPWSSSADDHNPAWATTQKQPWHFKQISSWRGRGGRYFSFKVVLSPGLSARRRAWQLQPAEPPSGLAVSSPVSDRQAGQPCRAAILLLITRSGTDLSARWFMHIMAFLWVGLKLDGFDSVMSAAAGGRWQSTIHVFFFFCDD